MPFIAVDFSFDLSYRPVDPSKQAISDKSDDPHSLLFYVLQVKGSEKE